MRSVPSVQNVLAVFAAVHPKGTSTPESTSFLRSGRFLAVGALLLGAGALSGCGGGSSGGAGQEGAEQSIHLVYVDWVEGVALSHVMSAVLQDSLGMDVEMTQVTGAGTAFSAVASGDADVFTEVWLPTTHQSGWEQYQDQLTKVGQWYEGTSVGLVVPAYTDIQSVSDLPRFREALDGEINGIESGAAINQQAREVLKDNDIDGFNVVAASSPATWSAVQRAIENREPIVATGWQPHWKWSRFDLRYLEGAQTGQTPIFGAPENIFMVADTSFQRRYADRVTQFFQNVAVNDDEALNSLMQPFQPNSDAPDKMAAARAWVQNHRELVAEWVPPSDSAQSSSEAQAAWR